MATAETYIKEVVNKGVPGSYFYELRKQIPAPLVLNLPIFGIQGIAERGSEKPMLVTADTLDILIGDYISTGTLKYELNQFFENGGDGIYVSVVRGDNATKAEVTLQNASPTDLLKIEGKTEGSWGDNITYSITANPRISGRAVSGSYGSGQARLGLVNVDEIVEGMPILIVEGATEEYAIVKGIDYQNNEIILQSNLTNAFTISATITSQEFDLVIGYIGNDGMSDEVESFTRVNMSPYSKNYVEHRVNDENFPATNARSDYITVTKLTGDSIVEIPPDGSGQLVDGTPGYDGDAITDSNWSNFDERWKGYPIQGLAAPENTSINVIKAAETWVNDNPNVAFFIFTHHPDSLTDPYDIKDFRLIDLGFDNPKMFMEALYQDVNDPAGFGYQPTKKITRIGTVLGIFSRFDKAYGVHRVPAGLEQNGISTDAEHIGCLGVYWPDGYDEDEVQEILNPVGIAMPRTFDNRIIQFGGRTLTQSRKRDFLYRSSRRYLTWIENVIQENTQWLPFKINDPSLWIKIRTQVNNFLKVEASKGALTGPIGTGYTIKCDQETYDKFKELIAGTDEPNVEGQLCQIGVALNKPGEFFFFSYQITN